MKYLILFLFILSNNCFSQELNPRWLGEWIGNWGGNQEILKINKVMFQVGTYRCQIVTKVKINKSEDCIIVYGNSFKISKKEITEMYSKGLAQVKLGKDNQALKDYQTIKIILDGISEDTYRFLALNSEGSEDSATHGFILDKENIYKIEFYPYGDIFNITQYARK